MRYRQLPIPSIICCIGITVLSNRENITGVAWVRSTSIVSFRLLWRDWACKEVPPVTEEFSPWSSGSRSSAWVIHSKYPRRSSSICCFSRSFWKSPRDLAFSLSFENSLKINVIKQLKIHFAIEEVFWNAIVNYNSLTTKMDDKIKGKLLK